MLQEILGVRQDSPGLRRRWYQDDFFDLYTWHVEDDTLVCFQLCYDLHGRERAFTWHRRHGFSHNRVDHVTAAGRMRGTPLLAGDERFPHRLVRSRFRPASTLLDAATRTFILDKMREFGRHAARGEIVLPRRQKAPAPPAMPD
jgi:hypothetical protein